jgi:hypothetical protein
MQRLPKGYRGIGHQTIGSDLLGIVGTLKMPDIVLGKELAQRMREIKPDGWYPIAQLEEIMEKVRHMQGTFAMRQMGRNLFDASHAAYVRANVHSVRQLLESMDDVYRRANRGTDIGGWKLTAFDPAQAVLEKNTIHDCIMEEGIILQAIDTVGARANVSQTLCFRRGDEFCRYQVTAMGDRAWDVGSPRPT